MSWVYKCIKSKHPIQILSNSHPYTWQYGRTKAGQKSFLWSVADVTLRDKRVERAERNYRSVGSNITGRFSEYRKKCTIWKEEILGLCVTMRWNGGTLVEKLTAEEYFRWRGTGRLVCYLKSLMKMKIVNPTGCVRYLLLSFQMTLSICKVPESLFWSHFLGSKDTVLKDETTYVT
jgi:hypothetical protein